MTYIYDLDNLQGVQPAIVGGKATNLARLRRAGFPVPPGFVVGATACQACLDQARLTPRILATVEEALAQATVPALLHAADQIWREIEAATLDRKLAEAVASAYAALSSGAVVVRSSASGEDSATASHAGQYESFLHVNSIEQLLARMKQCWASLWSTSALVYRSRFPGLSGEPAMGVIVQRQVHAETAGVLFTAHPVTGRRDQMVIEAVRGLGDSLVSGRNAPDHWLVDGVTGIPVEKPVLQSSLPCLTSEELQRLVAVGRQVSNEFGAPSDIEWAFSGGRLYVLQSRPITHLP